MTVVSRGFLKTSATIAAARRRGGSIARGMQLESRRDLADDGFVQMRDRYFREQ